MDCWRGCLAHSIYILAQPTYLAVKYFLDPKYFSNVSSSWLAVTFISWLYIVTQLSIPFFTNPLRGIASPKGERFPIGHFKWNGNKPPTENIEKLINETPNDGMIILWYPFYLVWQVIPTHPDTMMEVLNAHNYDWEKPAPGKRLLRRVLGDGLVLVEGDTHKSMRKAVAPAFSGRVIRDLVPLFYSKGVAFANTLAKEAKQSADGALEMMSQMSHVTLDIIGAACIGKDFNTIENNDDPLAQRYAEITDTNRGSLLIFFLVNAWLPHSLVVKLKGTVHARIAKATEQLRQEVSILMQEKKQAISEKPQWDQEKNIISTIMRSGDFSDDYLVDQLLTFLAAGHDTTASALTWTMYLLSKHPKVQERLRAECVEHLAGKSPTDINATIFDAETTPYLHGVCNETLRLYPTVPATMRLSIRPTRIGTQAVPTGTRAIIAPWAINRSTSFWGSDAVEFKPERWITGPNASIGGATNPYSFITFLHGPRSCIGQGFARTEMKCLLAALIMRFEVTMADPTEKVEVGGFVTIKPQNGLRIKLKDLKGEI